MEVVRVADRTIVGMMPGDDTPRDSVTFGVGAVAFSGEMVRNMAVCAVVAELVFGELVFDSPAGLEPWAVRL
jgi:hypothetical protein